MPATRRITITDKQLAAANGSVTVERYLRLRCDCGNRADTTVTVWATPELGWPSIRSVEVTGDPVTAMVKTVNGGYIDAARLNPTAGRPYPGRTEGTVHLTATCQVCGVKQAPVAVKGTYNPSVECNDVCQGATGPNCDCRCAGANHGRNA